MSGSSGRGGATSFLSSNRRSDGAVTAFKFAGFAYPSNRAYTIRPPRKRGYGKNTDRRYITMKESTNQNRIYLDAQDSVNSPFENESAADQVADGLLLSYIDTLMSGNEN